MTYGFFVAHESEPRATAAELEDLRLFSAMLTETERMRGWTIRPFEAQSAPQHDFAGMFFAVAGSVIVLIISGLILMCVRGCR